MLEQPDEICGETNRASTASYLLFGRHSASPGAGRTRQPCGLSGGPSASSSPMRSASALGMLNE